MATRVTLAELRRRDVAVEPHEAVAVVQLLLHTSADGSRVPLEPPFGLPSLDTVAIDADGSVCCLSSAMTLSAQEAAILLQQLIGDGNRRIPGGLRYAIGRALHEVEAPPFDSVDEFSEALERFEQTDRLGIVASLHARACAAATGAAAVRAFAGANDRRHGPSVTDVRRQLREADLRMYQMHQLAATARAPRPVQGLRAPVAACMIAGVVLVAAGEMARAGMPTLGTPPAAANAQQTDDVQTDAVHAQAPAAAVTPPARTSDIALPTLQPPAQRETPARATAAPQLSATARGRAATGRALPVRTRAVRKDPRPDRQKTREAAAARERAAAKETQDARSTASRPPQDDDGALLKIRFVWDNPFK